MPGVEGRDRKGTRGALFSLDAAPRNKLAIGPANYAGQAYYWADAVNEHLGVPAISFANRQQVFCGTGSGSFQFPVHVGLPHHRRTLSLEKRARIWHVLRDVSHVALDGFLPVFSRLDRGFVGNEIERLQGGGRSVCLIAHGGDVRDPDEHMRRNRFSFFAEAPDEWVNGLRQSSARNRRLAESFGGEVFVSTPDLLLDLPKATWLPLCVDVDSWHTTRPVLEARVPRVLHMPSRRRPPIKGTAYIDPVLSALAARGRIEYISPEGLPHASMMALIQSADIVIDQILTGSYGVAAVEGMAAGRLVVGYLGDMVRSVMPSSPPILDATPLTFLSAIEQVLDNREQYIKVARDGLEYVKRWHSGVTSAVALTPFLAAPTIAGVSPSPPPQT